MAPSPLFSILMPTHCRPDVIPHAISSVLDQNCGDFELLVTGDGANADTAAAVAAFDDPRIRWFDLPKAPGFGYANRNIALQEARGQYIAFAADDDLLLPHHLSELKQLLEGGAALACTRALWVSSDGIAAPFSVNLGLEDEREAFLARHNNSPASCFAYRVDALREREAWPEEERQAGDWRLWQRIIHENPSCPLACSTSFTVLHFSARRKNARDSQMPELRRFLEFADRSNWWPADLKVPVPLGSTAQAEWLRRLQDEDKALLPDLNRAVQLVIDRLAWEYIQSALSPAIRKLAVLPPEATLPDDFDPALYLRLHPDVAAAGVDPSQHWLMAGYFEGRPYKAFS
jgi:glycosyltransferase involved in cell wall biosynthesis